jgi:hypothetical protein
MNIKEINTAIITGTFTNDELTSIGDAVKFARTRIATQNKFTLTKGTKVQFTGRGGVIIGTVEKVAIKRATVNTPLGRYAVPLNMLSVA